MKKQSRKEREAEILRQMEEPVEGEKQSGSQNADSNENKNETFSKTEEFRCPNCNAILKNRKEKCPKCGYNGYVPMSEPQTRRIKWILFFILLAIAIIVLIIKQQNG